MTIELDTATVPVSEVFPAWQGEGPDTGRRCTFLRLGLCNLACSWCDTPYTWDHDRYDVKAECPPRDGDWIVDQVLRHGERQLLVVSGGEPLMHRNNDALRAALAVLPHEVHVETNGTLQPSDWLTDRVSRFVVSPKVAQDNDPWSKRIKPRVLRWYAAHPGRAVYKFVARNTFDMAGIVAVVRELGLPPADVWVMPEGTTAGAILVTHREIAEAIETAGFNTSTRLHVLLYGDQRGR